MSTTNNYSVFTPLPAYFYRLYLPLLTPRAKSATIVRVC